MLAFVHLCITTTTTTTTTTTIIACALILSVCAHTHADAVLIRELTNCDEQISWRFRGETRAAEVAAGVMGLE